MASSLRRLGASLAGRENVSQPEFTFRAVALGLLIGVLLCFTNLYFGLQTGWISMMSLQSALIGFLLSRLLPNPLSPQENIVVQTTAVATGTMPLAAGFVGILPALGLLTLDQDGVPPVHLSWAAAAGWSCAVAFFGVFLSPPLRKQVIIEEKLAFPSGTATAQLVAVLHRLPPPTDRVADDSTLRKRAGYSALAVEDGSEPVSIPSADDVDDRRAPPAEEGGLSAQPSLPQDDVGEGAVHQGEEVRHTGWATLGWSFLASSVMTLLSYFFPVVFAIPLFGTHLAKDWLWTFTPSLSYVGQGIIMGFPTTVSMNLGMLVGWGILSPLSKSYGWAPGPVGSMTDGARGWILWTSLAVMCADSLVSLVPVIFDFVRKQRRVANDSLFSRLFRPTAPKMRDPIQLNRPSPITQSFEDDGSLADGSTVDEDKEVETEDRLVPIRWVAWGLSGSVIFGTLLVWAIFGDGGIKWYATVVAFVIGGLLSVLGVRALGETDLNPVSGLGKISQLVFALIQPGNVVANIIAGGVAEAGAQQAGDLMQDLKTGHLIQASPRAQFYGQLIGSALSIVITTTAYSMYQRAYTIPGPSFPAPTAYVWLSLARLLRDGSLPERCGTFMLAFGLVFGAISGIKTVVVRRRPELAVYIPSGVAFAIGFLNTPSFSLARLVGGVIEYLYHRRAGGKSRGDIRLIIAASGFVLGEGVISVVSLALRTAGVDAFSCWGCSHGLCGGCPT